MAEPLTRSLGDFVSKLRLSDIPTDALRVVHTGFADCVGTMIAGSIEDPPKLLEKALSPPAGDAKPGPGSRTSIRSATTPRRSTHAGSGHPSRSSD